MSEPPDRHCLCCTGSAAYSPEEVIAQRGEDCDTAYIVLNGTCDLLVGCEGKEDHTGQPTLPSLFWRPHTLFSSCNLNPTLDAPKKHGVHNVLQVFFKSPRSLSLLVTLQQLKLFVVMLLLLQT